LSWNSKRDYRDHENHFKKKRKKKKEKSIDKCLIISLRLVMSVLKPFPSIKK
jgi:hypothetical protein